MTAEHDMLQELSFKYILRSPLDTWCQLSCATESFQLLSEPWVIDALEQMRDKLNSCKAQVGTFTLVDWQKHTDFTELSSGIGPEINKRLTNRPPVLTRAWIKFYDILNSFDLFNHEQLQTGSVIRTLFLCEAPGAFVNATNHYIKSNYMNIHFDWMASTLNPYYEKLNLGASVLDDRFIQDVYCYKNWFFGHSNNGDIFDSSFVSSLKDNICSRYSIEKGDDQAIFDCITGDGAFDCLECPERQEELVFELIYAEVTTGLKFLKHNGSMVIKFFTFFSCNTLSLLYFMCNCFRVITCYKPVASKDGNSEVYLVCLNFDRVSYLSLFQYFENVAANDFIFVKEQIPNEFLNKICEVETLLSTRQKKSINSNVQSYEHMGSKERRSVEHMKFLVADQFIKRHKIFSISVNNQLVLPFKSKQAKIFSINLMRLFRNNDHNNEEFNQKLLNQIKTLKSPFFYLEPAYLAFSHLNYFLQPNLVFGTFYSELNNSKFCCHYVLRAFIMLKSTLQSVEKVFPNQLCQLMFKYFLDGKANYLVNFMDNDQFTNYLNQELLLGSMKKQFSIDNDEEPVLHKNQLTTIHFMNLYDLIPCATSNDFIVCHKLRNQVEEMLREKRLKSGDWLVIRFKILLSRLSVGLLYLLTKAFRNLGLFFAFIKPDSIYPSLLCVLQDFVKLPDEYRFLFDHDSDTSWTTNLLEVVSTPTIISDVNFYNAIFNVNSACLLSCLKEQVKQKHLGEQES